MTDYVRPVAESGERPASTQATIAASASMRRLFSELDRLSRTPRAPALIFGEIGAGRRHFARILHDLTFPDGEFLSLDAAVPASRFVELYRGRQARSDWLSGSGSTLYVREISALDSQTQSFVLELAERISEGQRSVRLIASSSLAPAQLARGGQLKSELLHRFPTVLELPPLRDRREDIGPLLAHFAQLFAEHFQCERLHFSDAAIARLAQEHWPGNVAELSALVERLSLLAETRGIDVGDLPLLTPAKKEILFQLPPDGVDLSELEKQMIEQALKLAHQNQTRAAALVGLTRDQLRYRMGKFGLCSREDE
ncbi:MAG TPA: helix-turn-helix domain-containing protein [Polyangiaceae bacterium]|jgi:DNA-binding NtrC family response regulator